MNEITRPSAIVTREVLLQSLSPLREFKRSHHAIVEAHEAEKEGEPDHAIRLKAAELNLKLLDAYPKSGDDLGSGRPINVAIVLSQPPNAPLPGVKVITSDNK